MLIFDIPTFSNFQFQMIKFLEYFHTVYFLYCKTFMIVIINKVDITMFDGMFLNDVWR